HGKSHSGSLSIQSLAGGWPRHRRAAIPETCSSTRPTSPPPVPLVRPPPPEHRKFVGGVVLALSGRTARTGRPERENDVPTCGARSLPGIATPRVRPSVAHRKPGTAQEQIHGSLRLLDRGWVVDDAGHGPHQTYVPVFWGDSWEGLGQTGQPGAAQHA